MRCCRTLETASKRWQPLVRGEPLELVQSDPTIPASRTVRGLETFGLISEHYGDEPTEAVHQRTSRAVPGGDLYVHLARMSLVRHTLSYASV